LITPSHALRGSRSLSNFTCHVSRKKTLGSRVDAPQKPNCRSLVQGLERQGLRRHLPFRFSVRAESRDGNTSDRDHTTPARHARPPAARARVWHALVHFLTSQVKWNKSHHISQGKRSLDFQCGTIGILHHYTP
jgi:hypothetical protein